MIINAMVKIEKRQRIIKRATAKYLEGYAIDSFFIFFTLSTD